MTSTLIQGVALLLDGLAIGSYEPDAADGTIYLEKLPQTPAAAIGIFSVGGFEASGTHGYDLPVISVQVRGAAHDVPGALAKSAEVYAALQGLHSTTLPDGTYVVSCKGLQSGPNFIGFDDNDRPGYSLNFSLETRNVTTHRE